MADINVGLNFYLSKYKSLFIILSIKICHPSKNSIAQTHKNDGNIQTKEAMNINEGRKHKQQGQQQKPQTHSQGQQRQRIPKGMRNHTKTGTKGAQTTDKRK